MRRMTFIATVLVILAFSASAFGASSGTPTLVYDPDMSAHVELAPGGAAQVPMKVSLENGESLSGLMSVTFLGNVDVQGSGLTVAGKSPMGMLNPSDPNTATGTTLTVRAPEDAKPGDYSVIIKSSALLYGSDVTIDPGAGLVIDVTVVGQSEPEPQCAAPPTVRITQSEPEVVWTPNKEMVEVTIKATVDSGENCTLGNLGYTVEDEYEELNAEKTAAFEPDGRLDAPENLTMDADGNITLKVTVEASRHGDDPNGRNYGIRLTAINEKGSGMSQLVTVTVSHDQGKQKEAKR